MYFLPVQARFDFYFKVILSSFTYGMLVWGSCGAALFCEHEKIHVRAAKLVEALLQTKWKSLKQTYIDGFFCVQMCLRRCLWSKPESRYILRRKDCLVLPKPSTNFVRKSVKFVGASLWNYLDNNACLEESVAGFLKVQYRNLVFKTLNFGTFYDLA